VLDKVDILGVRVHCTSTTRLLNAVADLVADAQQRIVLYVNAHCLNVAQEDTEFRSVLNAADLVYADGVAVVWASRWLHGCQMEKATGADWIEPFCALAQARRWRVYILAGQPGVAAKARTQLEARYSSLYIVGTSDGYFVERSETEVLRHIAETRPDVIFIGLGTPRQEKWLAARREELPAGVYWVVGALFDYLAGVERRAPGWMRAFALEWAWRLLINPIGKGRRYLIGNPLFVLRVVRQRLLSRQVIRSR
jgi:N-acetylglucosaminyldiphosphoundecaprenol N-acetyl-beta-D-mannosaminyltransferase